MNSIDRNQAEENREDLQGPQAVRKIKDMVEQAENCFFCSAVGAGDSNGDRPMNVRQVDDEGNLWFLSASDSLKNQELAARCALNALAAVDNLVGLENVVKIVKVTGFVASAPGFTGQPAVVNGSSELLGEIFGEAGVHARSAVGVAELPLGAPVEVELIVEIG